MKKFITFIAVLCLFVVGAMALDLEAPEQAVSVLGLIRDNAAELLLAALALVKIIVRITPTVKDDEVFAKLDKFIEWILPNITKKIK